MICYFFPVMGTLRDSMLQDYDSGHNGPRLKVLSWLTYIGWHGYHRATYLTDEMARGYWFKFVEEELRRAVRRAVYGNDRTLLEWFEERDKDFKEKD